MQDFLRLTRRLSNLSSAAYFIVRKQTNLKTTSAVRYPERRHFFFWAGGFEIGEVRLYKLYANKPISKQRPQKGKWPALVAENMIANPRLYLPRPNPAACSGNWIPIIQTAVGWVVALHGF